MIQGFRFGIGLRVIKSAERFRTTVRRFAELGYDVIHLPDHLGAPAPFPALVAAADAAPTIRIGTYVLNSAFYSPALLARDALAVDTLSGARLELGLGTGYVRAEFEAAGIPYPSAGARVDHLARTSAYIKDHAPSLPLMIAGNGDRVLSVAAQYADIVGLGATVARSEHDDPLAERIAVLRAAAGERFAELELNLAITAVPTDSSGIPDLTMTRAYAPDATDAQLLSMPSVLCGTPQDIADKLGDMRERYGVTYFIVQDYHGEYFAEAMNLLR